MSVTKWVHISGGDEQLRALFAKVHALLAPGGVFVLEPQPWRSYKPAAAKLVIRFPLDSLLLQQQQQQPEVPWVLWHSATPLLGNTQSIQRDRCSPGCRDAVRQASQSYFQFSSRAGA